MNALAKNVSIETVVRENPGLNDPATLQGLHSLIDKLTPLIQGERFHNLVDMASALSDVVDMADHAMVEKLAHGYENLAGAAFNLNNTLRYASARAAAEPNPPTLWQTLRRLNRDEDARRGLAVVLNLLILLGQDARYSQDALAAND